MQKDLDNVAISPFQEKIAVENFFSGAGRGELLSQMQEATQSGSAVLAITGEEGCGKTMMCRMLECETTVGSKTVFFPQTVESYEDVIQILAMELGVERAVPEEGQRVADTLRLITDHLKNESLHLVIIFDEAENIYLATLERIRKMLDHIVAAGASAHIIFAGRNNFIENCEQLTMCEFQQDKELHFEIEPFSEDASFEYLRECSEKLTARGQVGSFTDDVVRKIYEIAKGNIRMINILAEESLKNQGDDTSFMVLLDSVSEEVDFEEQESSQGKILGLFSNVRHNLRWVGGAVLCGIVLMFFIWPDEDVKESEPVVPTEAQVAFIANAPEVVYKEVQNAQKEQPVKEKSWKIPETPKVEPVAPRIETPAPQEEPVVVVTEEIVKEKEPDVVAEQSPVEVVEESPEPEPEPEVGEVVPLPVVENGIVQLRQVPPLKRQVVGSGTIKVQPPTEVTEALTSNANDTVEQVYQKRVLAGTVWESHSKDQMFTVQLMVLTAEDAEDNLKRLLAKEEYRGLANNIFIFQKGLAAEVIFVFYGEYPSIVDARNAKNSLPDVLRDQKPYAISIKDAVKKSQR